MHDGWAEMRGSSVSGMILRRQVQACDEAHPTMMRPDSSSTMMLARPVRRMILPTTVTPEQKHNHMYNHSADM